MDNAPPFLVLSYNSLPASTPLIQSHPILVSTPEFMLPHNTCINHVNITESNIPASFEYPSLITSPYNDITSHVQSTKSFATSIHNSIIPSFLHLNDHPMLTRAKKCHSKPKGFLTHVEPTSIK